MSDYHKYEGLPFSYGISDCFSMLRRVYEAEYGIEFQDQARYFGWEHNGEAFLADNYKKYGFKLVEDDLKEGDVLLFALRSKTPNHIAIYIGGGNILHHLMDRPSCIEFYKYRGITTHHLRHKDVKINTPPVEQIDLKDYLPADLKWRYRNELAQKEG